MAALSTLIAALAVLAPNEGVPPQKSVMDQLKPFEGRWKGVFTMGQSKMDVDMTWAPFAGRWAEVSYTYSMPNLKLEYRVLMTANAKNDGFDIWMFGNDMPTADIMTGKMEGKTLVVVHNRASTPDVKFSIDADKNMVLTVIMPGEKPTTMGGGVLKPVKS